MLDTLSAGISLLGTEAKSIRAGRGSLLNGRVVIRAGEALLVGVTIPPYQGKNVSAEYDPERTRRLLLTKQQIQKLYTYSEVKGLTLLPFSVYTMGRYLKLDIAIVRRKNARDKRETIKRREAERTIRKEKF